MFELCISPLSFVSGVEGAGLLVRLAVVHKGR